MHVLTFTPDGNARCLHTDALPLTDLGTLQMERASNIEWNSTQQRWEVWSMEHGFLFADSSRKACLEFEREFFNAEFMKQ